MQALVRQCKNEVMRWRTQASAECNEEVRRLLLLDAGAAVMDASSSTPTDNSSSSSSSGECAADISADAFDASNVSDIIEGSSSGYSMPAAAAAGNTSTPVGLPALVMLNLSRHPRDDVVTSVMLPALALRELDSPPLAPSSVRDQPSPPLLLCLGADNRALAVGAQHIVGVCNEPGAVAAALSGGAAAGGGVADSSAAAAAAEELARLDAMLSQAAVEGRMWANLEAGMFSAQVLMLSRAASATVASRLNPPRESFVPVAPSAATAAGLAAAVADLAEAKARLKAARRAEAEAQAAAAAGLGTESSSPAAAAAEQLLAIDSSNGTGSSTAAATAAAALVVAQLKGRDPQLVASRLRKRAKRLLAQVQGGVEETTWSSFMVRCPAVWTHHANSRTLSLPLHVATVRTGPTSHTSCVVAQQTQPALCLSLSPCAVMNAVCVQGTDTAGRHGGGVSHSVSPYVSHCPFAHKNADRQCLSACTPTCAPAAA